MSDLLVKVFTGVLRVVLAPIVNWLLGKGVIDADESVRLIGEIAAYVIAIGSAIYAWYRARQKQVTAVAMPAGSTEADVDAAIKAKQAPSVLTPKDVVPVLSTGTGNDAPGAGLGIGAILLAATLGAGAALSACVWTQAPIQTNPSAAAVQATREAAIQIADATKLGLVIADQAGQLAAQLPIPAATKDAIDCGVIKVTGTSLPPSPRVVQVCGAVPIGPGPLHRALAALNTVTAAPSLRATTAEVLSLIDPLVAKLEQSGDKALATLAVVLRSAFAFARSYLVGGVS